MRVLLVVCLILLMAIAIVQSSNAQSMNQLSTGKSILGFGLSFLEEGEIISGSLEHAISSDTTSIFSLGLGLFEEAEGLTFPPSPVAGVTIGKKTPPNLTPLGYFLYVGAAASSARALEEDSNRLVSTSFTLGGGATAGVFKPIEVSPDFIVIPFFGVSYFHVWTSVGVDYADLSFRDSTDEGSFSGTFGMEFNLSPRFSVFGSLDFSFEQSDRTTNIGINFF